MDTKQHVRYSGDTHDSEHILIKHRRGRQVDSFEFSLSKGTPDMQTTVPSRSTSLRWHEEAKLWGLLLPIGLGLLLVPTWGGIAGAVLAMALDLTLCRLPWQMSFGTPLARFLNAPFVIDGITDDDCVLGAEMTRLVREISEGAHGS